MGGSFSQANSLQSSSFRVAAAPSASLPSSQQLPHEVVHQLDELDVAFLTSLRQFGPMFCDATQCDAWKQLCRPGHLQRKQARETKERPTIRAASFTTPPHHSREASSDAGGASAEESWPRRVDVDFEPIGLHASRDQVLTALAKDGTLVVTLAPAVASGAAALNANTHVSLKLDEQHRSVELLHSASVLLSIP
jgi:hypothetical protein